MQNVPLMFQPLYKYAEFNGRSRRSEFWFWVLFKIIVGMVLGVGTLSYLVPFLSEMRAHPGMIMPHYFMVWPPVSLIGLALIIPSLAVAVRRLHDINRSGWWIVFPMITAIVGVTVFMVVFGIHVFQLIAAHNNGTEMSQSEGLSLLLGMLGYMFLFIGLPSLVSQIVMLVFYVTEGTRGPNRFGNDPKGHKAVADTFA